MLPAGEHVLPTAVPVGPVGAPGCPLGAPGGVSQAPQPIEPRPCVRGCFGCGFWGTSVGSFVLAGLSVCIFIRLRPLVAGWYHLHHHHPQHVRCAYFKVVFRVYFRFVLCT